jgi:hypothetical protein
MKACLCLSRALSWLRCKVITTCLTVPDGHGNMQLCGFLPTPSAVIVQPDSRGGGDNEMQLMNFGGT